MKFKSDLKSEKNSIYTLSYHKIMWKAATWWLRDSQAHLYSQLWHLIQTQVVHSDRHHHTVAVPIIAD